MTETSDLNAQRLVLCKRFISSVRHSVALGIRVVDADERVVRCSLPWREDILGNPERGVIHGGAVFTLMDQTGGLAVACATYPKVGITPTIDFRVDHLRAPAAGETVICEAECYRLTENVAFVRLSVFAEGEESVPVSTGLATYMRMKLKMFAAGQKQEGAQ